MMNTTSPSLKNKHSAKERYCIVSQQAGTADTMLRFVLDPQDVLTPDLKGQLPGRGAWIFNRRPMLEQAIKRKAFARSFKKAVKIPDNLPDQVDNLLLQSALTNLSLARRSGTVITGAQKVDAVIRSGRAQIIIHAQDAAEDGKRKIAQAIYARLNAHASMNGSENGNNKSKAIPQPIKTFSPFTGEELQLAFGEQNVVHIAIIRDRGAQSFIKAVQRLISYRGEDK